VKNSAARAAAATRIINFGAGPATLPREVLEQARAELLDWQGTGISVIEMSHRSAEFLTIVEQSQSDLRALMAVPDDYRILFMQGGATSQFAMVPLNLSRSADTADYLCTGHWSHKAAGEAARHCSVNIAADSGNTPHIPDPADWRLTDDAAYVFYTANETIEGVEFHGVPDTGGVPLVSDMTSNFLSRPLDISRFGLIFAGAQKNFGPSGLVVVIVREDLVGRARPDVPGLYDYKAFADSDSLINTPSTFSWYLAALMFAWIRAQGGVAAMEKSAIERSSRLYRAIDASPFYINNVAPEYRSRMNVPFTLADPSLDPQFLSEAKAGGMIALKGHRVVGGMRASVYNGMPMEGIDRLVEFMGDFERRHG